MRYRDSADPPDYRFDRQGIEQSLRQELASLLGLMPEGIEPRVRFRDYGLDSPKAAQLLARLGEWLGWTLPATLPWEYPTLEQLADHLAREVEVDAPLENSAVEPRTLQDSSPLDEPIAIVGIGCRFPGGATNPDAFWQLLCDGVDTITEVPPERWDLDAHFDEDPEAMGKMVTRWGGFLDEVDQFDPRFFRISAREAIELDPQQRLALEVTWEALEDANLVPGTLRGSRTGVFLGSMWSDYSRLRRGGLEGIEQYAATGEDTSLITGRIAYSLGLQGPSLTVNTACSSSLTAVHLASRSLRTGESDLALAGGVHLVLSPYSTVAMSKFGGMSPDGRCKAFDARANGYVRGEGCGVVVLKRLSRALAEGDRIYCLVRGSAVNNDGFSNGLTAPNPAAQEAVLRDAYRDAGVDPRDVQYVETHGPGTYLGDPIEAGALGRILGRGRTGPALRIGSVKTNLGHLEAAASIAGLIKTALSLHHGALPPSLHFETPNPNIDFERLRLAVQTRLGSWPGEGRRLAGVSGFGFGGANAHAVLEDAPRRSSTLVPLAGEDAEAVAGQAAEWLPSAARLRSESDLPSLGRSLGEVAKGRSRTAMLLDSPHQLVDQLASMSRGEETVRTHDAKPRVIFVCSGQGAHWPGMGQGLLTREPVFRAKLREIDRGVQSLAEFSVIEELSRPPSRSRVEDVRIMQPLIFAIQVGLGALWRSWGVEPDAILGQSLGEIAAAHLAGALDLEDAIRVVVVRSRLAAEQLEPGAGTMALVLASAEVLEPKLADFDGAVSVAVILTDTSTAVSGDRDAVQAFCEALKAEGIESHAMHVDYAWHSAQMLSLLPDLRRELSDLRPRRATTPMRSTTYDSWLSGDEMDADYWADNKRLPVRLAPALRAVLRAMDGPVRVVELSPHAVLEKSLQVLAGSDRVVVSCRRGEDERSTLLEALAELFHAGLDPDWTAVYAGVERVERPVGWTANDGAVRGRAHLLPLSAKDDPALRQLAGRFSRWMADRPDVAWGEICRAAAVGRERFPRRLALVDGGGNARALLEHLAAGDDARASELGPVAIGPRPVEDGPAPGVVFVFPGQGSQWPTMGRQLAEEEPVFRRALEACDAAVRRYNEWSVIDLLTRSEKELSEGDFPDGMLRRDEVIQPLLFSMAVSLAALWRSWGVEPSAVLGYSQGEIAAAHVAGILSLDDAARVVCRRSQVIVEKARPGRMAMVRLPADAVETRLSDDRDKVGVAVINSHHSTVIAGDVDAVETWVARFEAEGIFCRLVKVSYASHSPHMLPLLGPIEEALAGIEPRQAIVPMISSVTGTVVEGPELGAGYWSRNLSSTVRFGTALQRLLDDGHRLFLEQSAHPLQVQAVLENLDDASVDTGLAVGSLKRGQGGREPLLHALAELYCHGVEPDWPRLAAPGRVLSLPTYPFQRQRFWLDLPPTSGLARPCTHPWLDAWLPIAGGGAVFEARWSLTRWPYLTDHRVFGTVFVPGVALLDACLAAADEVFDSGLHAVRDAVLRDAVVLPEAGEISVQLVLRPSADDPSARLFELWTEGTDGWTLHAEGSLVRDGARDVPRHSLDDRFPTVREPADLYDTLHSMGLDYGPAFTSLTEWSTDGSHVRASVRLTEDRETAPVYGVHPALIDGALHALIGLWPTDGGATLPFEIGAYAVYRQGTVEATVLAEAGDGESGSLALVDVTGEVVAEIRDLRFVRADASTLAQSAPSAKTDDPIFLPTWRPSEWTERRSRDGETWAVLGEDPRADGLAAALEGTGADVRRKASLGVDEPLPLDGLVTFWAASSEDDLGRSGEALAQRALEQLQRLLGIDSPPVWWIGEGTQSIDGSETLDPSRAVLWGLGRSWRQEQPDRPLVLVDAEPGTTADALLRIVDLGTEESELAIRRGRPWVARLARASQVASETSARRTTDGGSCQRLEIAENEKGRLDRLRLVDGRRQEPEAGEVEVQVQVCGLNFRDVMVAMGLVPQDQRPLGCEFAGVIERVGPGVEHVRIGDAVIGLATGSFTDHLTLDARRVCRQPRGLDAQQAAAIPIVYLTAWYALRDLAKVDAGERLLIHAASGGVGMAAVQLAQLWDVEVFGTASRAKWDVVRNLGVEHVSDSRSDAFVADFRAATGGQGVDVVLNSLAGELVDAGLSLLSPGGRFIEMGKTDLRSPEALADQYPGLVYAAFDLLEVDPDRLQAMLREVVEAFEGGHLQALPVTAFPLAEAESAFRHMAQAKHVGKLVLVPEPKAHEPAHGLHTDGGTVLISGGLGALGLLVARFLAERGAADHLLLLGRREPEGDRLAAIDAIRQRGVRVTTASCDVADADRLAEVVAAIPEEFPLRGIVHAAMVLDDGTLESLDAERLARVFAPKVAGAWTLHRLSQNHDLRFFVMFSSVMSLLGSAGQGNYSAANAFLDALATYRRQLGLPAQSLNWGPWAALGAAASLEDSQRRRLQRQGLDFIEPQIGLDLLEQAMARDEAQLGLVVLDPQRFARATGGGKVPCLLRDLVRRRQMASAVPSNAVSTSGGSFADHLRGLRPADREGAVAEWVRAETARVLALGSPQDVPTDAPLRDLGLDSLTAVELRNALAARAEKRLSATVAFDHPNVEGLARHLLRDVFEITDGAESSTKTDGPAAESKAAAWDGPIAIVSMSCRFPGDADSPEAFWTLLESGRDAVAEVPPDRWDIDAWYDPDPQSKGKMTTRWGGFLNGVDRFDPAFFGIAPREAETMDPQQRLLLEVGWEALERAGIAPSALAESQTGVFVGMCAADYGAERMHAGGAEAINTYSATGAASSVAAGRISYVLGLQGPAISVDTACSSSLVSIHLACQSLRAQESDLALAGGVNLIFSPQSTTAWSRLNALSPTGRCRTFSAEADGFVRSEGCALLVLKRLADAERDGDDILAVIRGTAVNQDGRSSGLTAPNGPSQERVIRRALAQAGLEPSDVDYVECHGTGTILGDPIEVQALGAVLGEGRADDLLLGSVKSNIGHAEGAAGVAGLIKTVLALQHETLPGNLHWTSPNPHIPWQDLPVEVVTETRPWHRNGRARVAGISSFGVSGTNAHVLVGEAPAAIPGPVEKDSNAESKRDPKVPGTFQHGTFQHGTFQHGTFQHGTFQHDATASEVNVPGPFLLPLSAKDPAALRDLARQWSAALGTGAALTDLCHTAALGRDAFEHRLAVLGDDRETLRTALEAFADGERVDALVSGRAEIEARAKWVFVFPGQGSQWDGMGRRLFDEEPVFRDMLLACDEAVARYAGWSVVDRLLGRLDDGRERDDDVIQPLLFSMAVSLAALWRSWGVEPAAVLGYSQGEVAAAHVCGALTLDAAARVVCERSRVIHQLAPAGRMAVVRLSAETVRQSLQEHQVHGVSVAVINSASSTVVAGDAEAIERAHAHWDAAGVFSRVVKVAYASHCAHMEPLLEPIAEALSGLEAGSVEIPMISTVTGGWLTGPELGADYWCRNLRTTVDFAGAMTTLLEGGHRLFVEPSPHPLQVQAVLENLGEEAGASVGSLKRDVGGRSAMLRSLAELFCQGYRPDWTRSLPAGRTVLAPTYPFQRRRYWATVSRRSRSADGGAHPVLGKPLALAAGGTVFDLELSLAAMPSLDDHRVDGRVLAPVAWMLEAALAGAEAYFGPGLHAVRDVVLPAPIVLPETGRTRLQLTVMEDANGAEADIATFTLHGLDDETWQLHAEGLVQRDGAGTERTGPDDGERVELPEVARDGQGLDAVASYGVHPMLTTRAFEAILPVDDGRFMPFAVRSYEVFGEGAEAASAVWLGDAIREEGARGDVWLHAEDGTALAVLRGVALRRAETLDRAEAEGGAGRHRDDWLYSIDWTEVPESLGADGELAGRYLVNDERLVEVLERAGAHAVLCTDAESLRRALASEDDCAGLVSLWIGEDPDVPRRTHALVASAWRQLGTLLEAGEDRPTLPPIWWLTVGAQATKGSIQDPAAAALWGLARVWREEQWSWPLRTVDVEPATGLDALPRILASTATEQEMALRHADGQTTLLAPRLGRAKAPEQEFAPRTDGTVLIAGGLGAIGLETARWLVEEHGVQRLVLLGRSAPDTGQQQAVDDLRRLGVDVETRQCDIADLERLAEVMAEIPRDRPLVGVIHAAVALADGVIGRQNLDDVARALVAKVDGAWNLHRLTESHDLDFFVLYSSVAALIGPPGLGAYAAANAFLDALAGYRAARGLPAQSLDLGTWAAGGVDSVQQGPHRQRLERLGFEYMDPAAGMATLGRALALPQAQVGVLPWNLRQLATGLGERTVPSLLRQLVGGRRRRIAASAPETQDFAATLRGLSDRQRRARVGRLVRGEIARVLAFASPDDVANNRPLKEQGLDSLTAVELRNALSAAVSQRLPATLAFDCPTAAAITERILDEWTVKNTESECRKSAKSDRETTLDLVSLSGKGPSDLSANDTLSSEESVSGRPLAETASSEMVPSEVASEDGLSGPMAPDAANADEVARVEKTVTEPPVIEPEVTEPAVTEQDLEAMTDEEMDAFLSEQFAEMEELLA